MCISLTGFAFIFIGALSQSDKWLFVGASFIPMVVAMLPLLVKKKKIDIFEPIILVILAIFIGTTGRALFITFDDGERVDFLLNILLGGKPFIFVLEYSFWFNIGILAFVLGYIITKKRIMLENSKVMSNRLLFSRNKIIFISLLCLLLSVVGNYLYAVGINLQITDISNLSFKRPVLVGSAGGADLYSSMGHLRILNGFAEVGFYILLLFLLSNKIRFFSMYGLLLTLLVLSTLFVPFVSSARSEVVLLVINMLIILWYKGKYRMTHTMYALPIIFIVLIGMGYLRSIAHTGNIDTMIESPLETVLGSGNSIDMSRTAYIMDSVPERLNYYYGETYLYFLTGFIPRVIWPEKPNVSLGPTIKREIYGLPTRNNGYPPGMIAEAYMNFGYAGIPFIMFIFGFLLRLFYNSFRPLLNTNNVALLVYVAILWRLSFGIGINWSQMVSQVLINLLPAFILLILVSISYRSGYRRSNSNRIKPSLDPVVRQ